MPANALHAGGSAHNATDCDRVASSPSKSCFGLPARDNRSVLRPANGTAVTDVNGPFGGTPF
jgi:hypothetical protein